MIDKTTIKTKEGDIVEASAPVIISASRSTDIPAFYAKWFFNRLKKGYCAWYNPFNQKPTYVSFKNCKVVVFWTKNPEPMIDRLDELAEYKYYFQFTLTGYGKDMECNVPHKKEKMIPILNLI